MEKNFGSSKHNYWTVQTPGNITKDRLDAKAEPEKKKNKCLKKEIQMLMECDMNELSNFPGACCVVMAQKKAGKLYFVAISAT